MTFRRSFVPVLVVLILVSFGTPADAQTFPSHELKIKADSGDIYYDGARQKVVWRKTIRVRNAVWLRLYFDRLVLAHDVVANTSSTLRITSLKDGAVQVLDAKSARQWRNSSAYFNGSAVRLELLAYPNSRLNRISVEFADVGEVPTIPFPRTICDTIDDRVLSTDVRVGRTVPGGCTAWLFNDQKNCMLTAGHCAASTDVIGFNVPVSNPDGSYNHPGPEDQYVVDLTSMQFINGGVGNDWCYFGCFENSNTGLTAFEAQGDSFQLELPEPVMSGDTIRITGHGTTSAPVDPSFNGAQKTHVGPHSSFSGSTLNYRTDTTGGNSGSPVILENDGTAIGIHTHGGCSSGGAGANTGTGANNLEFQIALANPMGVCKSSVDFEFPNGRPDVLVPAGGTTFRVNVTDGGATPQPGTGMLHYDDGSGFQAVPMAVVSPNVYDAVFPATPCGIVVDYYVSIQSDMGETFSEPGDAPDTFFSAISAESLSTSFLDDFEADLGWTVSGDATDGQWERGVPAGAGDRGDPTADGDGSGSCYVTDNVAGNSDVDGGSTILTSPVMDGSVGANQQAVLTYYRWYDNTAGNAPQEDTFVVEISNDGGSSWSNLEIVGPSGSEVFGGWVKKHFLISDFVAPSNQMRLRFTASDLINGSVVEAGVDGVEIQVVDCVMPLPPEAFKLADGIQTGGSLSSLFESDNQHLDIDPSPTSNPVKQTIDLILQRESTNSSPTTLGFRLEASMSGGPVGDVQQEIQLFNYVTNAYETLDLRDVESTDTVVEVFANGDLTRFIHPINDEITAQITFNSQSFSGGSFFWSVEVDQAVWLIN